MKLQDKKGIGPELITVVYIFHKKLLYLPSTMIFSVCHLVNRNRTKYTF